MLGHSPKSVSDIYDVFAKYVEGKVPHIPWCENPLQPESFLIQRQLAQLNRAGFLTINSQPAVDGIESSNQTFGWGGKGGFVYQKAYCECFCSPENMKKLVEMVKANQSMNLYAVNNISETVQEGVELGGTTGKIVDIEYFVLACHCKLRQSLTVSSPIFSSISVDMGRVSQPVSFGERKR